MHDKTTEYEESLRQAYEALGKAFESSLVEFKTRLMEADFALTAAMNHRLAVLRGEVSVQVPVQDKEKGQEKSVEPPPTPPAALPPPEPFLSFPHAVEALRRGEVLCTYPECKCEVQMPTGSHPTILQCPEIARYEQKETASVQSDD